MEITLNPACIVINVLGRLCRQVLKLPWQHFGKHTFDGDVWGHGSVHKQVYLFQPKPRRLKGVCLDSYEFFIKKVEDTFDSSWIIWRTHSHFISQQLFNFLCCCSSLQQPSFSHRCILTSVGSGKMQHVAEISSFTPEGCCVSISQVQCGLLDLVGYCH